MTSESKHLRDALTRHVPEPFEPHAGAVRKCDVSPVATYHHRQVSNPAAANFHLEAGADTNTSDGRGTRPRQPLSLLRAGRRLALLVLGYVAILAAFAALIG